MCLAIWKPAGKFLPVEHIKAGFAANPHGAGFAFSKGGKITIRKGFFNVDHLIEAWKTEVGSLPAMLHFRWATHGKRGKFNCHPWELCNGRFAMIHNGILPIQSTEDKSDTGHFADLVLSPSIEKHGHPSDPVLKYLIESAIGGGNKIVVMDEKGHATIYQEKAGQWEDGIWYSNDGFRPQPDYASRFSDFGNDDWELPRSNKKRTGFVCLECESDIDEQQDEQIEEYEWLCRECFLREMNETR
jgi:hypothetical protein